MKKLHIAALILVSLTSNIQGQMISGRPSTGSTGFVYTYWELETAGVAGKALEQFWAPLNGFIPLKENLEARFYLAGATNNLLSGSTETHLYGPSDTRFEITRSFSKDKFFISGGVNLPTGKTELFFNPDRAIIELLSESFLAFPMRRFGEGLGFSGTAGTAKSWGNTVAGLGFCYDLIGKYRPYANFGEYNPGDVFTAKFGLNIKNIKTSLGLGANFLSFSDDKMDNIKVFRQGRQAMLSVAGTFDNQKFRINPSARYTIRGRNTRYEGSTENIRDRLKLYGNEFELGFEMGRYFRGGWNFASLFSILHIAGNEDNYGDSQILSYGASMGKKFSERISVGTWFKIMSGDSDSGRINLRGYQISASILAVL